MLNIILHAIQALFSIIFMIAIGYGLAKKGWFDEKGSKMLALLVTEVSLPLYMIDNMMKNFTRDKLLAMAPDLVLPILSVLLALLVGKLTVHLANVQEGRRGVFTVNFFIANTMFIGLPVNLALFGEKSVPAVMLYYMVNTIMFWTLGMHYLLLDTEEGRAAAAKQGIFNPTALKKLFSPALIGFLIGTGLVLLNIKLPVFLLSSFKYVGSMTTPLSLIFIGIEMSRIPLRDIRFDKDMWCSLFGRFCVCPVCVLLLVPFIHITPLSAQVFTMQAAMPAMTQMAIVTKSIGGDAGYAATLCLLTVLAGIFVIPAYMAIVSLVIL